jgi:hypothetical protein
MGSLKAIAGMGYRNVEHANYVDGEILRLRPGRIQENTGWTGPAYAQRPYGNDRETLGCHCERTLRMYGSKRWKMQQ